MGIRSQHDREIELTCLDLGDEVAAKSLRRLSLSFGKRFVSACVQQSRDVLKHVDDLKALAATDTEPSGLFRIGVSHALADSALVKPVRSGCPAASTAAA